MITKPTNRLVAVLVLIFGLFIEHPLTQPTPVPPKTRTFDFLYTAEIRNLPPSSHDVSMRIPLPKADVL